jgi:hypothetical protein
MRKRFLHLCLIGILSIPAAAQQIVHALTGKVTAVYPASKTLILSTDDGSRGLFEVFTGKSVPLTFEKSVKALTVPAADFTKADCHVVVFYYGDENYRTVVAVEDLGTAQLISDIGTVVTLDKHAHLITIKDDDGKEVTFNIDARTVADSSSGVTEGQKFTADKGARVRITATAQEGTPTALFIRALSL